MQRGSLTLSVASLLICAAVAIPFTSPAQKKKPATHVPSFEQDVAPIVNKYCVDCHDDKDAPGGVRLTKGMTGTLALKDPALWQRIAKNVASKHMPPPKSPAPSDAQRQRMVEWIDTAFKQNCDLADPGRVTLRRLNREEYNNSVRDLLGVSIRPADDFPNDDVGYGFDNIGDVLSMSPLLMEKYLSASEKVVKDAIRLPKTKIQTVSGEALNVTSGGTAREGMMSMFSNGTASTKFSVKQSGWYRIQVRAGEMHAGPENARLELKLNRDVLTTFQITDPYAKPGSYVFPTKLTPGDWTVGVTFTNDYYVAPQGNQPAQDRNVGVYELQLVGPVEDNPIRTAFQRELIPTVPPKDQWETEARKSLEWFASRAYRRPITTEELDRLMVVFQMGAKADEGYERAMQIACQAVLCNPNFLFRVELDASNRARDLNDFELASRLSYFLWSSLPDKTLYNVAKSGELRKPAVLKEQVARMLKDPKADSLVDDFAMQWLQLRKLYNFQPDKKLFPEYSDDLMNAMLQESKMFFQNVMSEDRPILDFIDSKYTFVNAALAKHYGMTGVTGDNFRRVSTEGTGRGGVLTQASVLAITSNPTRTSPTKRGKWILEQILGTPPPPPPPGVGDLAEGSKVDASLSLRQKMEVHRKNPMCAACHTKMDALGFGFENYDAVGRWRTKDGNLAIDSSATLPDGRKFTGPTQLKAVLMGNKQDFCRSFVEKMMTFALGRGVDDNDKCFVDDVVKRAAANNYKFSSIVEGIAESDPFTKRKG
ncbi:MAG: DUF1592 domain-containing protein [Armatimonadetes bacterium]|nr:DUF1592 domain-containing protein [Armatimonadota bacterium]